MGALAKTGGSVALSSVGAFAHELVVTGGRGRELDDLHVARVGSAVAVWVGVVGGAPVDSFVDHDAVPVLALRERVSSRVLLVHLVVVEFPSIVGLVRVMCDLVCPC